jgi:hypothetical protein
MNIKKILIDAPVGNSSEYSCSLTLEVKNSSEDTVEMTRSSVTFLDGTGFARSCNYDIEENSYAEKNETFYIDLSTNFSSIAEGKNCKFLVDTLTFKREVTKMGYFVIPLDSNQFIPNNENLDIGNLKMMGMILNRLPPPQNVSDDHTLGVKLIMKNISNNLIYKAGLIGRLLDKKNEKISECEDFKLILPNATVYFELSASAKAGRLKDGKFDFSFITFNKLESLQAEILKDI